MRRWLIRGLLVLAAAGAPLLILYAAFPALVSWAGERYAAAYGLNRFEADVQRPGWRGMSAQHLFLAAPGYRLLLEDVTLRWSPAGLLEGRLEALHAGRASLVLLEAEAASASGDAAAPPAAEVLFGLLPFQRVSVGRLSLDVPEMGFRSGGDLLLEEGTLRVRLVGAAPEPAVGLELLGTLTRQGQVDITFRDAEAGGDGFLRVRSALPEEALVLDADLDLTGYPFSLLQNLAGVPAGDGWLRGRLQLRYPWPLPGEMDAGLLQATGKLALRWLPRQGPLRVPRLEADVNLASGTFHAHLDGTVLLALEEGELTFAPEALTYQLAKRAAMGRTALAGRIPGAAIQGAVRFQASAPGQDGYVVDTTFDGTLDAWERSFPLAAQARVSVTGAHVEARGKVSSGVLREVPVSGRYDKKRGSGELALSHHFRFSRPLLADLWPGWSGPFDLESGGVRIEVALDGSPAGSLSGTVAVTLEDVAGHLDAVVFRNLNGNLNGAVEGAAVVLGPSPLAVGLVDPGVPIRNLRTSLSGDANRIQVAETTAELLGGRLVVAPFSYGVPEGSASLEVRLTGIDLAAVLALEGEEITGAGTLDVTLPMELQDGRFRVRDGRLEARAPGGAIRLDPELAGSINQPGLDLALAALTDFRYEVLQASVDYSEDGDLLLGVRLEGRNPAIERGRAIHFNLNVSENIPVLLRSLRLQDAFTERIEQKVQQ